jgi:hypothetical protein
VIERTEKNRVISRLLQDPRYVETLLYLLLSQIFSQIPGEDDYDFLCLFGTTLHFLPGRGGTISRAPLQRSSMAQGGFRCRKGDFFVI